MVTDSLICIRSYCKLHKKRPRRPVRSTSSQDKLKASFVRWCAKDQSRRPCLLIQRKENAKRVAWIAHLPCARSGWLADRGYSYRWRAVCIAGRGGGGVKHRRFGDEFMPASVMMSMRCTCVHCPPISFLLPLFRSISHWSPLS